ncbi:MAG: TrpB-like pyridoxal-phosphate dependent enzyme, partial [Bacteroidales bacterium]|nr:TrpB-like pyridoxal-phosphate dependent enzyme [Bacteroidales bacterium]
MKQKKFILPENEIPTQWYNIMADMPVKPMPMLNPQTRQPVTVEDLSSLFSEECSRQELNQTDRWIDIPEEVRERYANYRCTPLVRAYGLESALGTPAHIYFKN